MFVMGQDYCASKFAAVGFHESLAHELLAEEVEGVKTTLVCPYIVDTGMFEGCKIRLVCREEGEIARHELGSFLAISAQLRPCKNSFARQQRVDLKKGEMNF